MSNDENGVNRCQVRLDLKDVYGNSISDKVRITFRNQCPLSLSQEFMVEFSGSPVVLPEPVPAFPFGGARGETARIGDEMWPSWGKFHSRDWARSTREG